MNGSKLFALMEEVDEIIITGHKNPDFDSVGSAVGLFSVAKKLGKKCRVILSGKNYAILKLMERIKLDEDFKNIFLDCDSFRFTENKKTLLIIVDTSRKTRLENIFTSGKAYKTAVIDHHNKSEDFIKADFVYYNPEASSTSEMVVDMIRQSGFDDAVCQTTADALLSGIMVDTKNFCFKTSDKTFLAAAYLKQKGADCMRIKELFREDLKNFKERFFVLSNSEVFHDIVLISKCPDGLENPLLTAAQASDDFINVSGIEASFVLCEVSGTVYVSARSLGNINLLDILGEIGGGGNVEVSGAQIENAKIDDIYNELKLTIEKYLKGGC